MSSREMHSDSDDLHGSPAWEAMQWRAAHRRSALSMPFGLRKIECPVVPGSGPLLTVGVFAGIHGDEPAGTLAVQELAAWARRKPAELVGYALHLFPVCNPTGQRAGTRHSRTGLDLNREFWNGSDQPEVRSLEAELRAGRYDVIVALHEDATSDGIYGFAGGTAFSRRLLEPALTAAAAVWPRNMAPEIDGFPAENGIIGGGYRGMLSAPPEQRPRALEVVFKTPALASQPRRVAASILAVQAMLKSYRARLAHAGNL